jgi:hypothetical protein
MAQLRRRVSRLLVSDLVTCGMILGSAVALVALEEDATNRVLRTTPDVKTPKAK